ncbi:JNK-interacting protein [Temnothorax longispinosus]|uniref:JNK-interacting protein n=1 Tax=Temnothorax longispinosus TaxID=300112 RepID=A0A4S2JCN2_9HYME|nr:JNK-interacting protein [Temnothorax longispinosus]
MADSEFEEFRHYFERLPQHLKAPLSNYTLVHDVMIDDSPTSSQGSDGEVGRSCDVVTGDSEDEEVVVIHRHDNQSGHTTPDDSEELNHHCSIIADSDFRSSRRIKIGSMKNDSLAHYTIALDDISLFGGLSSRGRSVGGGGPGPGGGGTTVSGNDGRDSVVSDVGDSCSSLSSWPTPEHVPSNRPGSGGTERRRRRLPEIPKSKKFVLFLPVALVTVTHASYIPTKTKKTEKLTTLSRPQKENPLASSLPTCQTSTSLADELSAATGSTSARPHLVLRKCHPRLRHEDSSPDSERMATDSGHSTAHSPDNGPKSVSPIPCNTLQNTDSVSPSSTPGVNLRTGRQGIFPSAYAVDMDYSDFDPTAPKVKRERYLLGYLDSVETLAHKGTGVVCQAVRRILRNSSQDPPVSQSCILEVSDQGLRMVDRSKPRKSQGPCHDYFYSLKNVSFCAFHPRDHRYLGFITKHPTLQRFACHVFIGQESTRPVAEAVGRAFHRFYTKFIETAFPIEDIYIE